MANPMKKIMGDVSAGFAVSLIALPLALGLAAASGVPPMAGLLTAIVGGIVVSIFGGSNVTISGPGNGLVVVVLSAVMLLGRGDMMQGYLLTCAAVVVSGGLLILFGYLRLGALGDFFPSSAIQGLLAAIGLIIISKQIHVMLGVLDAEGGGSLALLYEIPESIRKMFNSARIPWEGYLGIASLLIMALYSKIKLKAFHMFPAPMWVLFLAVGFWAYFTFIVIDPYPILESFLIPIPDDILDATAFPDFSMIGNMDFWFVVLGITLISSIESLLSIKAVDKLDPQARRSNINKDLKALGLGSVLSGLIGGLPVVMVIARSSVNVNNGASTRKANFFHAFFLLIFLFLLKDILRNIPVSTLAGILVYTGYKLASPEVFKKVYNVGREQLFIFIGTLLGTLAFGLIQGIAIGIVLTILVQLSSIKPTRNLIRYVIKPNTLLYQESENKFYLGVKGYAGFLNYLRLKSKLDSIPHQSEIVLDMSLANYVDHSVMEHIHYYSDEVERRGGKLEVIGLDVLDSETSHPFAPRKLLNFSRLVGASTRLTKRQMEMQSAAKELLWEFTPEPDATHRKLKGFQFGSRRQITRVYNMFKGTSENANYILRDFEYDWGEFIAKESFKTTIMVARLNFEIPEFRLSREDVFKRFIGFGDTADLDFKQYPDFSRRFYLNATFPKKVEALFTREIILFFESNPYYHIECNGKAILIFERERLASISEIKGLIDFSHRLVEVLYKSSYKNS
jgi:carbonic anhydrase